MSKLRFFLLLACLAVISLWPRDGGHETISHPQGVFGDVVVVGESDSGFAPVIPGMPSDEQLAEGRRLFDETCSTCHSTGLVFKSGVTAAHADSLIGHMLSKDDVRLTAEQRRSLAAYLSVRLPQQ